MSQADQKSAAARTSRASVTENAGKRTGRAPRPGTMRRALDAGAAQVRAAPLTAIASRTENPTSTVTIRPFRKIKSASAARASSDQKLTATAPAKNKTAEKFFMGFMPRRLPTPR